MIYWLVRVDTGYIGATIAFVVRAETKELAETKAKEILKYKDAKEELESVKEISVYE